MALFSHLRKLVGFTLAMLIFATSVQPVQAHLSYGDGHGNWLASVPSTANPHGPLDAALYIAEENEGQAGRQRPSDRLGADDPLVFIGEISAATTIAIPRDVPPYRTARADSGVFLSPLKTGPPSV
jgi:hypothetical protein